MLVTHLLIQQNQYLRLHQTRELGTLQSQTSSRWSHCFYHQNCHLWLAVGKEKSKKWLLCSWNGLYKIYQCNKADLEYQIYVLLWKVFIVVIGALMCMQCNVIYCSWFLVYFFKVRVLIEQVCHSRHNFSLIYLQSFIFLEKMLWPPCKVIDHFG